MFQHSQKVRKKTAFSGRPSEESAPTLRPQRRLQPPPPLPDRWSTKQNQLRIFTLQRPRRQDVLIHVVKVIGEDEVLRGRRAQAQEGRVQVEGARQSGQTRVVDHAEAGQRLDLLPAVELLPQRRRHLRQGLSEGETAW